MLTFSFMLSEMLFLQIIYPSRSFTNIVFLCSFVHFKTFDY